MSIDLSKFPEDTNRIGWQDALDLVRKMTDRECALTLTYLVTALGDPRNFPGQSTLVAINAMDAAVRYVDSQINTKGQ